MFVSEFTKYSIQPYELTKVNSRFFPKATIRENEIEEEIRKIKAELKEKLTTLNSLRSSKQDPGLTKNSLEAFFKHHPAMRLAFTDTVSLSSNNQGMCFHTEREHNRNNINNDIIYVTLPLYGFKMDFLPKGKVKGEAVVMPIIAETYPDLENLVPGHPHATHVSSDPVFRGICQGNNDFIVKYAQLSNDNIIKSSDYLEILSRAAIWLETVNLSDMYGTLLIETPQQLDVQELMPPKGLVNDMFKHSGLHPDAPDSLRLIREHSRNLYLWAVWSLWLYSNWGDVADRYYIDKYSLYWAVKTDCYMFLSQPETTINHIMNGNFSEYDRLQKIALKCPGELYGYYPVRDFVPYAPLSEWKSIG